MNVDLVTELYAAQGAMTAADRVLLRSAGVPDLALAYGLIGAARIDVGADGLYQPAAEGARAYIVPVRIADPVSPEWPDPASAVLYGDLVDLAAMSLRYPARWALRTGAASWLGTIGPQFLEPPPVRIARSPLGWLIAGGGLCILTHEPGEAQQLLLACRALEAEDADHARELRRLVARPFPAPAISTAHAARREAA